MNPFLSGFVLSRKRSYLRKKLRTSKSAELTRMTRLGMDRSLPVSSRSGVVEGSVTEVTESSLSVTFGAVPAGNYLFQVTTNENGNAVFADSSQMTGKEPHDILSPFRYETFT